MATAQDRLNQILPSWYQQLSQWSLDGSLVAAATNALMLDSSNAKQDAKAQLQSYVSQWSAGKFKNLPEIVLLSAADISGARGAYSATTGAIYLNEDWLAHADATEVKKVLSEELGHSLDYLLNTDDTELDEGEVFAGQLLEGTDSFDRRFSNTTDDQFLITVNGAKVEAEASATYDWVTQTAFSDTSEIFAISSFADGSSVITGYFQGFGTLADTGLGV